MSRRTKLIILIITTLLLLGIGLWLLIQPFISPPAQPPGLPTDVTPSGSIPSAQEPVQPQAPSVAQDIRQLENLAINVVTRIGSGSNSEGFRGYEDVMLNVTPSLQAYLQKEQTAMQTAHPVLGSTYGLTSRVVAVDRKLARSGADTIPFVLQVQRTEDAGNPDAPVSVSYHEATVTFKKQAEGGYLVEGIVWKDIQI
ncbi:MAG: hypothetical protein NUV84_01485 [Candidatus Uhrbacteria bacterium]|nr:hypothetical protein [bacterium]MCR4313900.1 hypothetical protein [Candidatus Uhrbacteria bacterium]